MITTITTPNGCVVSMGQPDPVVAGKCAATTKQGAACSIDKDPDSAFCHMHRPNGKFRQQHPLPGQPRPRHCEGTRKGGKPCRIVPDEGDQYCYRHR